MPPRIKVIRLPLLERLFKESFWIALGQAMAMLGLLVGVRLLTELLDPSAYGELALGMTISTLINQILLGPLGGGVIRFYAPAVEQGDVAGYLTAVRRMVWMATGVVGLIVLITVAGLLAAGRDEWVILAVSALIFATISGYNAILSGIQNAARQRSIVALHQGLESWIRFAIAIGLIYWLGASSGVAMAGYVTATLIIFMSQSIFFRKIGAAGKTLGDNVQTWRKQIWEFSWPMSIFGIFTWGQLVSDRWALEHFSETREVGLYAVLYQLGYYPMTIASGMMIQLLIPILYQKAGDATDSRRITDVSCLSWRLTWLTLGLASGISFLAFPFHEQIFSLFVAKEYLSVSYLLPWMLLSGGVFAAGQTIALNLMSQMKTRLMMTVKIVTSLFGIALNCAGAFWYGTAGIAVANLLFSLVFFAWMALISEHNTEKA